MCGCTVLSCPSVPHMSHSHCLCLTGVAVHVKKRLVFSSFADASVRVLNVDKRGSSKVICGSLKRPTALSVDWLHNRIYICDESEVIGTSDDLISV